MSEPFDPADLARRARTDRDRRRVEEEYDATERFVASIVAQWQRLAMSKTEAAEALGVSVEFFDLHIEPELRAIRRGRRVMYPVAELVLWLWISADDAENSHLHPTDNAEPEPDAPSEG